MGIFARLSHKIGNNLVRSNVIKEEDAEIYIYGINQICVSVLNVSSALIIGLILDMFVESIIFMVVYIPLRSFAGGYHAKTPVRCYFASLIIVFAVLILCKYAPFNLILNGSLLVMSLIVIAFLCPVQDNNKPLDNVEHRKYKKISIIILFIEVLVWIIMALAIYKFTQVISMEVFIESMMLISGKIKNKRNKKL